MYRNNRGLSVIKWALLLLFLIFIICLVALYSYLNSQSFTERVRKELESAFKMELRMDSFILSAFSSVKVTGLELRDPGAEKPTLILPEAIVSFSLVGLLKREIESVRVSGPRIFIDLSGDDISKIDKGSKAKKRAKRRKTQPGLPVVLKLLKVEDAFVELRLTGERVLRAGPIDLILEGKGGSMAHVTVEAVLSDLSSETVKLDVDLDLEKFDISEGNIDLGVIDLATLSTGPEALLAGVDLSGVVRSGVTILKEEDGSIGLDLKAAFSGFKLAGAAQDPDISKGSGDGSLGGELNARLLVKEDFKSAEVSLRIDALSTLATGKDRLKAVVEGTYDVAKDSFSIKSAKLTSGLLGNVEVQGRISNMQSEALGTDIAFSTKAFSLSALMSGPYAISSFVPGMTSLSGQIFGSGSLSGKLNSGGIKWKSKFAISEFALSARGFDFSVPESPVKLSSSGVINGGTAHPVIKGKANLAVLDASFIDSSETIIGEGFDVEFGSDFKLDLATGAGSFNLQSGVKGFEALAGSLYADFTKRSIGLSVKGDYLDWGSTVNIKSAKLRLSDILRLELTGKVIEATAGPDFDLSLKLSKLSNKKAFDLFIKETFSESHPELALVNFDGVTTFDLIAKGTPEGFTVKGKVKVSGANIIREEPAYNSNGNGSSEFSNEVTFSLLNLNMELPVDINYPGSVVAGSAPDVPYFGRLTIDSINTDAFEINSFEIFPVLWQNSLRFAEVIRANIFAGSIALRGVRYDNLLSSERTLSLAIDIDDIDLTEMSVALGLPAFGGSLTGTIPKAVLSGTHFMTEGVIELKLFNGEMKVRGISIEDIFSPMITSIKSSVEIKGIDLAEITRTFSFGQITGILDGYIQDLVITQGQPVSFVVQMETQKTRGVSQKISVEALEKISVFSSGNSISVLDKGIYKFFKEYNYNKMGLSGRLKNDKFTLLGIEMEDNKRYIVKGAVIPPRVNVISYTREISFKEMIKRLMRISEME